QGNTEEKQPDEQPAGGGYDYGEQHGGQWQGFEPERRDYGPGYRSRYTYRRSRHAYPEGYDYSREHGGQWQGFEPERRDYGYRHGEEHDIAAAEQGAEGPPWRQRGPHSGKGPKGYRRADESIFEEACHRLTQHGEVDAGEIEVSVEQGEITLSGTAADRRQKRAAEDALETIRGVRDVHNRLTIPRRE
ncbi:MAG: BON domain-containing protein, partial [Candidatus Promineifilaceae bacterium]|nr:BON domain-containing protein [Candidatus Promineifilaceae bacterium]